MFNCCQWMFNNTPKCGKMTEEPSSNKLSIISKLYKTSRTKSHKKSARNEDGTKKNKSGNQRQEYFRMFMAELIGTALLMFLGCMGCITNYENVRPDVIGAFCFGISVMLIIQLFGHISGAHLNPAVTIATVIYKMITPTMACVYFVAQFIGATLGYGLLKILVTDAYAPNGFCGTNVNEKISTIQAFGIEIIISTVLILVCSAVWDKANKDKQDSTPVRFGLVIVVISICAGPLTGASMNTARSFAPMVFGGGNWENHWIYWVGPNISAILGCGIYKFLFSSDDEEPKENEEAVSLEEINSQYVDKV